MHAPTPFRGYVPAPEYRQTLPSAAYDVFQSSEEVKELVGDNEANILHVTRPEIDLATDNIYSPEVYQQGRTALDDFIARGLLVQDEKKCFYVYRQVLGAHTQTGLIALSAVEDYEKNIKTHENTVEKKERDRIEHVDTQDAQIGPVFLTFRTVDAIAEALNRATQGEPVIDIKDHPFDHADHALWRIEDPEEIENIQSLFSENVPTMYIVDGHHRAKSAFVVGQRRIKAAELAGKPLPADAPGRHFLSVMYPVDDLCLLDYNRIVKSCDLSTEELIQKLSEHFIVENIPFEAKETPVGALAPVHCAAPTKKNEFSMLRDGEWYRMTLREPVQGTIVDKVDSQILTALVLEPIFGIKDLRNDPNIMFVGGSYGLPAIEEYAKGLEATHPVGFCIYPVKFDEVMDIADAGVQMPPKSTWVSPKALSGLVVHVMH